MTFRTIRHGKLISARQWHLTRLGFSCFCRSKRQRNGTVLKVGTYIVRIRIRAMSKINRNRVHELLYADDAAIVSHTDTGPQSSCDSFAKACDEFGLKIKLGKTVVLFQGISSPPTIMINGSTLGVDNKFTYLGATVINNNLLDAEISCRIGKASTTFGNLREPECQPQNPHLHVMCSQHPSLLQWNMGNIPPERYSFSMSPFNLGVSWEDKVPNIKIFDITCSSDMYTMLRARRLRWTGHVCRQGDTRLPKTSSIAS